MARSIGAEIAKMHDIDVVHGDLTTSNMLLKNESFGVSNIVIIDFGLGMTHPNIEDKAVDLYVLERAFHSTHPGCEEFITEVLDSYRLTSVKSVPTLQRLEQVGNKQCLNR